MHGPAQPASDHKPALQPDAAIGPALRAIGGNILAKARLALTDPERSNQDAVHDFRRAMKQWRALMRLLEPFIPDADRWRREARDHGRSLAHARDGTAALAQRIFDTRLWRADQPLRVVLIGTDFEVRVWETLLKIPMGRAVCYSDIAARISSPKASRAVARMQTRISSIHRAERRVMWIHPPR